MAPIRKKDQVTIAVARAQVATDLFAKASAELDSANTLLDAAVAADVDELERLKERVLFSRRQQAANARVIEKLKDFTP